MKPIWIDATDMDDEPKEELEAMEEESPAEQPAAQTVAVIGVFTDLAAMPEKAILNEIALANALNVTRRTIRRMVQRNEIPPPVALAGQAVWFAGSVLSHIQWRVDRTLKDAARRNAARERLLTV